MIFSNQLETILFCPVTKSDVSFDFDNSVVRVHNSDITYPIKDGIIDFLPDIVDITSRAYDDLASIYDSYITSSNISMRMLNNILWGFSSDHQYAQEVLSFIPNDMDSVLLDIPVGTGILTVNKYRNISNAKIIAMDYSLEMLKKAKDIFNSNGVRNAAFIRADVGNLPIKSSTVGSILSMNGFHAFSQKDKAATELERVLKKGGSLIGSLYIKGKRRLSDFFVDSYFSKQGTFSPPFLSADEFLRLFKSHYEIEFRGNLKSFFYFKMAKRFP